MYTKLTLHHKTGTEKLTWLREHLLLYRPAVESGTVFDVAVQLKH